MMRYNPFRYAEVVTGNDFIDRENEKKELIQDLFSGQNIILYSPRRYGKTSLIKETFRIIGSKAITVYADMYGIMNEEELAQRITNELMIKAYTTIGKLKKGLQDLLSMYAPKIIIESGNVSVKLTWDKENKTESLENVFDLPQKIAEKQKKKVVVAFDEFQEIMEIDGVRIEKLMRSKFQHHKDVTYLFAGSKISMLLEMFGNNNRAFYKFGKIFPLKKISNVKLGRFIKRKFRETGKNIGKTTVDKILSFVDGHPYFMQQLSHEVWALTKKRTSDATFQQAVKNIITKNRDMYLHIFDNLTKHQKLLLIGMSKEPGLSIYSKEFMQKYMLTSSQSQKSFLSLENKRIIENGEITDVFFKEWVKTSF